MNGILFILRLIRHVASAGHHEERKGTDSGTTTPTKTVKMWVPDYADGVTYLLQVREQWRLDMLYFADRCDKIPKKVHHQMAAELHTCPFVDDMTDMYQQRARQRQRDKLVQQYANANKTAPIVNNYGVGGGGGGRGRGHRNNNNGSNNNSSNNNNRQADNNASQSGAPPGTPVAGRTRSHGGEQKSQ